MALVGRYSVPGPTNLHLDGFASGSPVSFDFTFDLTDTFNEDKLFIPKIWAQKAVDALVNEYYSYADGSDEAEMIRDSIVSFSMCYGIGSPFTSFTDVGGGGGAIGMEEEQDNVENNGVAVFPEPSLSEEDVVFDLSALVRNGPVFIRIYDALGQLLYEQDVTAFCGATWTWNGLDSTGQATKGALVYRIDNGLVIRTGRLTRIIKSLSSITYEPYSRHSCNQIRKIHPHWMLQSGKGPACYICRRGQVSYVQLPPNPPGSEDSKGKRLSGAMRVACPSSLGVTGVTNS